HKFREVKAFADEVTVLRRGRLAGAGDAKQLSVDQLAEMMVGADPPSASLERQPMPRDTVVLDLEDLRADDDIGLPVLKGVNLKLHAGEIVGIAGVSGNGQDELV